MTDRHKVFISYHHDADQVFKDLFVRIFSNVILDWSVGLGDIPDGLATETVRQKIRDEWLRDSTVTVVLVGAKTWQRKHVDWEIGSSLRDTMNNPRSGLLGVLLPSYPRVSPDRYDPQTIPPRLADNLGAADSFARILNWTTDSNQMAEAIHWAFVRRTQTPPPRNSRDSFANNRAGERWA